MNMKFLVTRLSILLLAQQITANEANPNLGQNKYAHLTTEQRQEQMVKLFEEFADRSKEKNKGFKHYANEFEEVCNDNDKLWKDLGSFCKTIKSIKSTTEATIKIPQAFTKIGDNKIKEQIGDIAKKRGRAGLFLALRQRLNTKN
ncbi:TPA: hypothetical protein DIC20_00305 [Candidatus Dependentiae bacterium]|nr:MAG: hypothetical protein US03_C0002G0089 [candidate division TM6 bacterium GW2011_GWF2_36_131]KKQ03523.1 MAG: hypothetical protein US13_C0002G0089 [candidate division TM6 bacterium GW2011_GWE2_36_25]KKQ20203.1 MAG: hypothetical protein US32_C0001G0100 [candidate division TM6 bacterium GW2011_GWA2_36_9]HBR70743.1 hypothetical protein [Candidatus Dependentiae bacterium]HCU00128.1 hypothetical protein [Candidatus Dependentiae bacterium]